MCVRLSDYLAVPSVVGFPFSEGTGRAPRPRFFTESGTGSLSGVGSGMPRTLAADDAAAAPYTPFPLMFRPRSLSALSTFTDRSTPPLRAASRNDSSVMSPGIILSLTVRVSLPLLNRALEEVSCAPNRAVMNASNVVPL